MDVVYKTILIEKRSRPHSGRQMFNKIMSRTFLDMVGRCYNANYKLDLKLQDRDSDLGDRIDKLQKCPDTAWPATCATGPWCTITRIPNTLTSTLSRHGMPVVYQMAPVT